MPCVPCKNGSQRSDLRCRLRSAFRSAPKVRPGNHKHLPECLFPAWADTHVRPYRNVWTPETATRHNTSEVFRDFRSVCCYCASTLLYIDAEFKRKGLKGR